MSVRRVVLSSLFAFCLAASAQAAVLFDNTGAMVGGVDPIVSDGPQGASFSTDASGTVNAIGLLLDNGGNPNGNGVVEVAIYDDSGNAPNNPVDVLGDIHDTDLSATPSLFVFNGLNEQLTPDTRYWVLLTDLSGPVGSSDEWWYAADASGAGVAGEFNYNGMAGSLPNGDGSNGTSLPYIMAVVSSGRLGPDAPEPASLAVLGVGLAALGMVRLRRRR